MSNIEEIPEGTEAPVGAAHLGESKTMEHLHKYPIVHTALKATPGHSSFFTNSVAPHLSAIRNSGVVAPVSHAVDSVGNGALDQLDKVVPQLQTVQVWDITCPIAHASEEAARQVVSRHKQVQETLEKRVFAPVRNGLHSGASTVGFAVDSHVVPRVAGVVDPVVRPVNRVFERAIRNYFPEGGDEVLTRDGFYNEFTRSLTLVGTIGMRATPKAVMLPWNTAKHTGTTFTEQRKLQTEGGFVTKTMRSGTGTVRALSQQGFKAMEHTACLLHD
ncbi:hypothetical protein BABINDRAFT_163514 [Babjeviella inositovora NRRL Y-12698]|uniref:Uncharacterized protein n=1 Tax=Babjeviella inositovora NRRL Y-12698 TaxID=984486 RepID=A0A1E3QIS4_9ASCO|nr:uncharacterized protein BABINDRAFT_163514 [Babjeviella inositovora NRRL Y-12698]ODQ77508.1 hypothetical protein BABINDRAFT_163514 [Babjeviella inositovora NRRL Y-12698]